MRKLNKWSCLQFSRPFSVLNMEIHFIPTNRKGSIKRFLTRSKLKLTANPKSRKGRRRSQMIGYRIRAAKAKGQQTIKRKIQRRKVSMGVDFGFFYPNSIPSQLIRVFSELSWFWNCSCFEIGQYSADNFQKLS